MTWPHPRLLLVVIVISFCSNWQFAFQITYVNTSVRTFYNLANEGFRAEHGCRVCWLPAASWSSAWSTIVSSFYPGAILGFLMTPALTSRLGVKRTQIVTCMSAIVGCLVHFVAQYTQGHSENAVSAVLIVGRFLIGIQSGASLCLLPVYVMEISPAAQRPFLSTFQQVSQALGTLLGLVIGSEDIIPLGENRFLWLQVFAVGPTLLFVFVLLITPTTPHQRVKDEAETIDIVKSIMWYHGVSTNLDVVRKECAMELHEEEHEKGERRRHPITWATWKGFIIGAAAASSYAFTADDLVDTFSSQIINKATDAVDGDTKTADLVSVGLGGILVVASLFGTVLIDHFGRRKLLLFGLVGSALSNALVVAFPTSFLWVTVGFSFTKAFIGLGAGAPAWFLTSELVAPAHVSLFQSLSTGLLLVSTMLGTFFYLQLDMIIGSYSMLVLASGPSLFLALVLFLFLPETKDKTNDEVQSMLQSSTFSGIPRKRRISPMYGTL